LSWLGWWRRWQSGALPEVILSKAEAVDRVRQYAEANGRDFSEPVDIRTETRPRNMQRPQSGNRTLYTMALGTTIPMPLWRSTR
jgi:hypothetical protein